MKKTVFLHIGANKTGTTSIQNQLFDNRALLKSNGVLYPETGWQGKAHYPLSWGFGFGCPPANYTHKPNHWVELLKEIDSSSCSKVVLSSEFFISLRNKMQAKLIKDYLINYDVKIVVYLRRQDEYLESVYNQAVKMGTQVPSDIMEFYKKNINNYNFFQILKIWSDVFGKENLKIRFYENGSKVNIVEDFFDAIDEKYLFADMQEIRSNLSWNIHLIRFMAKHQTNFMASDRRAAFVQWFLSDDRFATKGVHLSPSQRKVVLEQSAVSNKKLAKKYFQQESLFDQSNLNDLHIKFVPQRESDKIEKVVFAELLAGKFKL